MGGNQDEYPDMIEVPQPAPDMVDVPQDVAQENDVDAQ